MPGPSDDLAPIAALRRGPVRMLSSTIPPADAMVAAASPPGCPQLLGEPHRVVQVRKGADGPEVCIPGDEHQGERAGGDGEAEHERQAPAGGDQREGRQQCQHRLGPEQDSLVDGRLGLGIGGGKIEVHVGVDAQPRDRDQDGTTSALAAWRGDPGRLRRHAASQGGRRTTGQALRDVVPASCWTAAGLPHGLVPPGGEAAGARQLRGRR